MTVTHTQWQCGSRVLDLAAPVVMGVLNVTPDSFSDGGRFTDRRSAVDHARRMIADGAAIIDIGGESTRPGASPADLAQELERVIPVIEGLRALDSLETEVLHGDIVAAGRKLGLAVPVNEALIALSKEAAAGRWAVGCLSAEALRERCSLAAPT